MTKTNLKALVRLSHKVVIYVPTMDKNSQPIDPQLVHEMEEQVAKGLSEVNGGATISDGIGFWVLETGKTCREKVRLVLSYTQDLEACLDMAEQLVYYVKEKANQEAVSLEVDNELFIL